MVIFMSLDGRFIHFLCAELSGDLAGGRIQKVYQLSRTDFLLVIRNDRITNQLYLSLSTTYPRLYLTKLHYDKPETPSGFCMLLRKHLEGSLVESITALARDRIVKVAIKGHDDLGGEINYRLFLEILGRYANLVLTDLDDRIIDAFIRIGPFDNNQRTIEKGALYLPPFDNKTNPENLDEALLVLEGMADITPKNLIANFRGISPLCANYLASPPAMTSISDHFTSFVKSIKPKPTLAHVDGKLKFYYFDLFYDNEKVHFPTLSALLEEVYADLGREERLRQISKNLLQFVKRELERNLVKLEKLTTDLEVARGADHLRQKGDLILANLYNIKSHQDKLIASAFETDAVIEIPLDPLMTPIQNANQYFKRYKKMRTSVAHIEEQINLTKQEIRYFSLIDSQIQYASQPDLDEISEELSQRGFTRKRIVRHKRKQPRYDTYYDALGKEILVGKNNLQNDFITHQVAKPEEWWFHTKDYHGAHVVVRDTGALQETTIRTAAQLASFFSKGRHSASVPVDYTKKRFVKKIFGELGSFVNYQNHKTIYIDPDKEFIEKLKRKTK
jgi:predicted ribosome quality control (RQC) complex YloA/Tae2 family protein